MSLLTEYDGFGFSLEGGEPKYRPFNVDEIHGSKSDKPADAPTDRDQYHVILTSIRDGKMCVHPPFSAHFLDIRAYARHMMRNGFYGGLAIRSYHPAILDIVETMLDALRTEGGLDYVEL